MKEQVGFKLPEEMSRGDFEAALAAVRPFAAEGAVVNSWLLYDTFDWRLFNRSLMLRRAEDSYVLTTLANGRSLHCDVGSLQPRFAWDFPQGDLRTALEPIISERALLPLAHVYVEETSYRILNKDQKTVVRLLHTQVQTQSADDAGIVPATYLSARPLRGYDGYARRLAADWPWGAAVDSTDKAILVSALEAAGHVPNSYSNQLDVPLVPTMRASEAAQAILRRLLAIMRANESGIKADIDVEFLHDYRIAVRKTRSALSLLKDVFPTQTADHFRREFRTLGQLTNDLRDLDVYLLAEADYRAMLPNAMRADIAPLFDYLRCHRAEAHATVSAGLESETTTRLLAAWEAFLAKSISAKSAANAATPIMALARKRIRRQYLRIVQDGTTALAHPDDELLHALRIECKKLRYLLEFFATLFPPPVMSRLIKQLKGLQDNLGEFTDLAIQQAYLLSVAESLDIDEIRARRAMIATGFLVETMARRQRHVKAEFANAFLEFAALERQKSFQQLFGMETGRRKI